MYQKAQQLRGRNTNAIRTFGIEDTLSSKNSQDMEKYVQDSYDMKHRSKGIATEAEGELNEVDKL